MKTLDQMSERQRAALYYIAGFIEKHGYPPTYREIAVNCNMSGPSEAFYHVGQLERHGFLQRGGYGQARALVVLADLSEVLP